MDTEFTIVLLLVFLGLSAFFSLSETAFFSVQRVRLHHLVASGVAGAQRVARMKEHPEKFLSTVLLGNNLANTAISALATSFAISILGNGLGVIIATASATVGIVVLGEAVPKTVAARHPERIALLLVRPLEVVERILLPWATLLYGVSRFFAYPFRKGKTAPLVSEEELRTLLRLGVSEGAVEETQAEIIHKTFRLGGLRARELMTPRTEIVWIQKVNTLDDFLEVYAQQPHMGYPIYEGEADNTLGVLYTRDVLRAFAQGKLRREDGIAPLMRPALFYPESKPVDDLFVELRAQGGTVALLVDEYGGVAGLVTARHIAGEIVGRLTVGEEAKPAVETIDERTIQVDASMRVEEANERLSLDLPDGEYETLAGFILAALGHIPREGEQVRQNGLRLVVTQMQGVKIERILVTRG